MAKKQAAPASGRQNQAWLPWFMGLLLGAALCLAVRADFFDKWYVWALAFLAGTCLACLPYGSMEFLFELTYFPFAWLFFFLLGLRSPLSYLLPFYAGVMISVSDRLASRLAPFLACLPAAGLYLLGKDGGFTAFTAGEIPILVFTLLMLILYYTAASRRTAVPARRIDLILCSYSGNTAHFAEAFWRGAAAAGAEVASHRFHYYRSFAPKLDGDALTVAYPVFGLKPPSSLLTYLFFRLPRGRGKPAFIFCTSFLGGSENGVALAWLALTLKGYRVNGRNLGVYPLNVPMLRLGPRAFWRFPDKLPWRRSLRFQQECGRDFAQGKPAGLPFVLWPLPFCALVFFIENGLLNRVYRNQASRKRCNGCGQCARYCPAERIRMVDGRPRGKGPCTLCLGCINNCPRGAMRFRCLPCGLQYQPPWREMIVRDKNHIQV